MSENRNELASRLFLEKAAPRIVEQLGGINPADFALFLAREAEKLSKADPTENAARIRSLLQLSKELLKNDGYEIDAASRANRAPAATRKFQAANQRANRNIRFAQMSTTQMFGKGIEVRTGDMGRHSRLCRDENDQDVTGRACPVCGGKGFHAFEREKANAT